ncbi:MAG: hypothetical protein ACXVDL_00640 [Bacteroidia bacterium]
MFRYIAHLAGNLAKIKMGESKLIFDIPHLVDSTEESENFDPEDLIKIFEFMTMIEPNIDL